MPIDIDPVRPSGISSTDEEHNSALLKAEQIKHYLANIGWPNPVSADSGNGAHLLYRIDLPNDDESKAVVESILNCLAAVFDDKSVEVDTGVFNAARIWKLYGTLAAKGSNTADRPHRRAKILEMPQSVAIVPLEILDKFISSHQEYLNNTKNNYTYENSSSSQFNLERWIDQSGLKVHRHGPWKDGSKWILSECPFNPEHTDNSAFIIQFGNGAIAAGCHHSSCQGRKWADLRKSCNVPLLVSDKTPTAADEWPPFKLPELTLSVVDPLDSALLPESYRPFVMDVSERIQAPPDYTAAALMTISGAVIGKKLGIRPKQQDDWQVTVNLWGAAIGRPGFMKTPCISEAKRFQDRLEIQAREKYKKELKEFEDERLVRDASKKVLKKEIEKLVAIGEDEEAKLLAKNEQDEKLPPIRQRFVTNDVTVEKLGELLAHNPNGLTVIRDELIGLLKQCDKPGYETQRAFLLEAWNGDGRFTYDRIGRGTVEIENTCISIFGGIQPGPLSAYVRTTLDAGQGDDGLLQRFQLLMWPDVTSDFKNVDRWPDTPAKDRVWTVFQELEALDPNIGELDVMSPRKGRFLRFTEAAQEIFNEWREKLEPRLRSDELHPALVSHLCKYRSLVPSLALVCHLIDATGGPVDETALLRALAWAEYLEKHAVRVYSTGLDIANEAALELIRHIRRGALQDGFKARDVYRNCWRLLNKEELASCALERLCQLDCLKKIPRQNTGGRPTEEFFIHPQLRRDK